MSQINRTAYGHGPLFHPVSHYDSPDDVLHDVRLSTDEKRMILSSWASDIYGVESQPSLREIPGIPHRLRLNDILEALKLLDDENDPPPRGGLAMRLPRFSRLDCTASAPSQPFNSLPGAPRRRRPMKIARDSHHARWTREANVRRYRKLLNTDLTDLERNYIERRLVEELRR